MSIEIPTTTPPTRSLHRKLAQVMYEAETIPKRGRAPREIGGYPFVQVGDAADFIRKALSEKVVTMMPTNVQVVGQVDRPTAKGGTMTTVDLIVTWTLTDGESGESIEIQSCGAGADGGDKYSGKASTSAMKYALLSGFLLSTGEDTEQHAVESQTPAEVNAREREQLAASQARPVEQEFLPDGGLIGTVAVDGTKDGELRETPTGWVLPFKIKNGRKAYIVLAEDALAQAVHTLWPTIVDKRVTVWGHWSEETIPAKPNKPEIRYKLLHLERIQTPDGTLPAPGIDEPPADMALPFEDPA
jgi:hypothetical protein